MTRPAVTVLLTLALAAGTSGQTAGQGSEDPTGDPASSHRSQIEEWRAQRLASLTRDTGWLTLAGLHPLNEGAQTLGSASESAIVLPASAPAEVGVLLLEGRQARLEVANGVEITHAGEPFQAGTLAADTSGDPTILEVGPVNFFVIERGDQFLLRVRDRTHPALETFTGIDYFPIDEAWRFDARFETYDPVRQIPIANIIGTVSDSPNWGAVVFEHEGHTYSIDALAEHGDEELFLIFGDETSGHETYGAGRYLYVDAPDENGRIDLDFNRAYNPPCAFTAFATCPLPPRQNRLTLRVEAGEKNYRSAEH